MKSAKSVVDLTDMANQISEPGLKRANREQLLDAIAEVRRCGLRMSAQIARQVVQFFQ